MRRVAGLCALMLVVVLAATACGSDKLSGTYLSTDVIAQSFTFHDSSVTMSAFGINANGSYKIDGDEIVITYSLFGIENTWHQPFSKSGNSIYIGGTEFIKQ